MTKRLPCPPAPGPLEAYAARFDDLFGTLAQRRGFREYLAGLLLPRDRNKTLTCLAGAEPVAGAQHAAVQRLQFFLSESAWDQETVNARRLELLLADPATAPHPGGVLVVDDSGDRKDGTATAHVGKQYLGSVGKIDRGVVTVTTCWADERVYYPVHSCPYTPAHHFPRGKNDPGFRTKLQIAADLAAQAKAAGLVFRAVAADCAYGDQDSFRSSLHDAGLPFVMALKPRHGTWAYGPDVHTPVDAALRLSWRDPEHPGDWTRIERTFRDAGTPPPGGPPRPGWAGGARTGTSAWWWPPPTRPPCRRRRPGTWPPTCPARAPHASPNRPTRPPPSPRSCGSTGCGTGSNRATSRSRTNLAGPTSRSAPMPPSGATRPL
ncbi:transposase [Streptomyces mirabilis]|uniref:IS701 family transposase n=1 Tax=Streptomyces mirabilis TaxID=68239 RepID=UPI00364E4F92